MISVIIPTRNRAQLLEAALESLGQQEVQCTGYEILIIDNGSTDNTSEIAKNYMLEHNNTRYFYEAEVGLHAGRHRGMKEALGDILTFIDDDVEVSSTWLSSILDAFSDTELAMLGGNNLPLFIKPPPLWLKQLWEKPSSKGTKFLPALSIIEFKGGQRPISPYYIWGCNFSIRKEVLLAAGGFHPDGMPKELIRFRGDGETHVSRYVLESNMKSIFHPGASVHHKVTPERMTFSYFYQRGYNQGISDSYTALRESAPDSPRIGHSPNSRLRDILRRVYNSITIGNTDMKQALDKLESGHHDGYTYHQNAYAEDSELRDWVHKSSYIE